jgi:hypothetical protein
MIKVAHHERAQRDLIRLLDLKDLRELFISQGRTGDIALHEYDPRADKVIILNIKHQREVGFE